MKAVIASILIFALIALIAAQTSCPSANFCEQCISQATGNYTGCGWCQTSTYGICASNTTCGYISGGTFLASASNCSTCTKTTDTPHNCEFGNNTFETTKVGHCENANTPNTTTSTASTTSSTTGSSCKFSQQCLLAAYSLECTYYCSWCNLDNYNSIGNSKYCQAQCNDYNNVSCKAEIASACATALPDAACTSNTSICNPQINASSKYVTTSGSAAATASSAATTATAAASTATGAASTATGAASTATGKATTAATAASTAATAAATATKAATTAAAAATSHLSTTKSSAAGLAVSALLVACVFLF